MRILVVAPTPFFSDRGTHIRILEEALALERLGHEITIATYHIGRNIDADVRTKIDVRRIRRLLFWYKKLEAGPDWQKILLDVMLIRKVFYLARTQKPDIIHGHLHEGVLIGWIVKKALFWRNMKLVADFHGSLTREMVSHGYLKRGLNRMFAKIEHIIDNMGDAAVASSWEYAEEIRKRRKKGDVQAVMDGAGSGVFKNKREKAEIKKDWELPQDKIIIGYTGGLVSNKGIGYLAAAIKMVLSERKDVFFLIGGFPAEHMQKFIKKNRLEMNVRLVSPLNYFDLPEFLEVCDLAIDPKDESSAQASGKTLNYMAAGLPVVCFDKKNNRKYLDEGGYFSPQVDAEGLARAIDTALSDHRQMEEKGKRNKKRSENFSWDMTGQEIERIYRRITVTKK